MSCIVTGGTGLIGSSVLRSLPDGSRRMTAITSSALILLKQRYSPPASFTTEKNVFTISFRSKYAGGKIQNRNINIIHSVFNILFVMDTLCNHPCLFCMINSNHDIVNCDF